jgi:hypothetical protein
LKGFIRNTFFFVHPYRMFHRVILATCTWICMHDPANFLAVLILL